MSVLQKGRPNHVSATRWAQRSQKHAWPHRTNAKPSHGEKCYSLFTPPTRTWQNCLVLSCPRRRSELWTQLQSADKTVLSCLDPVSNFQVFSNPRYILRLNSCKLKLGRDEIKLIETGSRQDKTVLYCLQLCSHRWHGQDKTWPYRRCEQVIINSYWDTQLCVYAVEWRR